MTNEETALKIQAGEKLYEQLWENNRGIISKLAFRFYRNHERACGSIGVELNDLIQCGFFALCDAAKAYNPDKGYMFVTYIKAHALNHFRECIGTRSTKRDPLLFCSSLDEPVSEEDGDTLRGETVPDPQAAEELERAEQSIWNDELREALDSALSLIPEKNGRVIKDRYYEGRTLNDCASTLGCSFQYCRTLERDGLSLLRRGEPFKLIKPFHVDVGRAYWGTGFEAWKSFGSVQEHLLELAENHSYMRT